MNYVNHILYCCVFLFVALITQGQSLKGRVIDISNQQALSKATIYLHPSESLTQTDEDGYFKFERLSEGRYTVSISYMGYETARIKEILVISGKEKFISIELEENVTYLEEAIVKPEKKHGQVSNEMVSVSGKAFTVEQTKRYAAAWGDPARMAQSFAGVTSNNDESNEIIIRGNSPKGLLWRIEGIEVSNPNHFALEGASGGGFGGISTNMLTNSDFYTGAFSAEYGNALSGVFDIKLRNGNSDKQEHSLQIGLQGIEASLEGPLSKKSKASYVVNYRFFTLGIFDKIGFNPADESATPSFQDVAFKLNFPNKNNLTSIWGIAGNSNSKFSEPQGSNIIDKGFFFAGGINSISYLNKKSYNENSFSVSGNGQNNQFLSARFSQRSINNYVNFRVSSLYNLKINSNLSLRAGFIVSRLGYDILEEQESNNFKFSQYDAQGAGCQAQTFTQFKWRLKQNLQLTAGLHYSNLLLNNTSSIEPRLGGKWQFMPKNTLSFGIGRHSRIHPIPFYNINFVANDTLSFKNDILEIPKANHFVLGYEFRPSPNWVFIIEAYYQSLYDQAIAANSTNDFATSYSSLNEMSTFVPFLLNSNGTGRNRGFELTAERYLENGFYLLNTTSLFESTYRGVDEVLRQGRFSTGFVENLLIGREWLLGTNKKNILGVNLRGTWAGGLRSTPILLEESLIRGFTVQDYSKAFDQRFPNYFRTDIRISLIRNRTRTTSTYSIDLNNFTNRQNPLGELVDFNENSLRFINQLGIIPVFTYRLDF